MRLTNLLLVVLAVIVAGSVLAVNRSVWVALLAGITVIVFAGMLALTRRP